MWAARWRLTSVSCQGQPSSAKRRGQRHGQSSSRQLHRPWRTLLLDNYDSFTFNLYQQIAQLTKERPLVIKNKDLSWPQLTELLRRERFDGIVLSPGPGTPHQQADVGLCQDLLAAQLDIPILGVCLGMQCMAYASGGNVIRAPEPIHGRLSAIQHNGHALFDTIPSGSGFEVVRYHSLVVEASSLPDCYLPIAWTQGPSNAVGCPASEAQDLQPLLMAMAHRQLPYYGVQFHPESVASMCGSILMRNFQRLCEEHHGQHEQQQSSCQMPHPRISRCEQSDAISRIKTEQGTYPLPAVKPSALQSSGLDVQWRKLPGLLKLIGGTEQLFGSLFAAASPTDLFWLDSSSADRGRFSFMGGRGGQLWRRITYKLPPPALEECSSATATDALGHITVEDVHGIMTNQQLPCSFWDYLEAQLQQYQCSMSSQSKLPFDFCGGFVGYLGYELKAQTCGDNAFNSPYPDASMFLADRFVAIDHDSGDIYPVALVDPQVAVSAASTDRWLATVAAQVEALAGPVGHHSDDRTCKGSPSLHPHAQQKGAAADATASPASHGSGDPAATVWSHVVPHTRTRPRMDRPAGQAANSLPQPACSDSISSAPLHPEIAIAQHDSRASTTACPAAVGTAQLSRPAPAVLRPTRSSFQLRRSSQQYQADVAACLKELHAGNSYELCLTNAFERTCNPSVDPLKLYSHLRRINPAPHAAFLSFGGSDSLAVCCSSPERFLQCSCDHGAGAVLTARPIKGTAARSKHPDEDASAAATLAASEKDRAENLMIVDLLRNDLGQVCRVGSVKVPGLMEIESFATVHQMVSTVQGLRRLDKSAVDCIRAAFPGGSMTGAPKQRSMQILDRLEQNPRGVYSGSIGYISCNGAFDLNIVIRTAVLAGSNVCIGAGGAVVLQSNAQREFEEMQLKAQLLMQAVELSYDSYPTQKLDKL